LSGAEVLVIVDMFPDKVEGLLDADRAALDADQ